MTVALLRPPPVTTARVFVRDHERRLIERRVVAWEETSAVLTPGVDPGELRHALWLLALSRVTDLPVHVLLPEVLEVVDVPDERPLPGVTLESRGKPLPGSGRFDRIDRPLVTL